MVSRPALNRAFPKRGGRLLLLIFFVWAVAQLPLASASEGTGPAGEPYQRNPGGGGFLPFPLSDQPGESRTVAGLRLAQAGPVSRGEEPGPSAPGELDELADIPDPLESINRVFFRFNDRLYFWALKPAAQGYQAVVPERARVGVRNFFRNLAFPIRFVNCLLQGKVEGAANEFGSFMLNSVFGIGGFIDIAGAEIPRHREDLGQTFGVYGMGPGFYIVWPFLGPSTLRDSVGMAGDGFLNPFNYLEWYYNAGARVSDVVNETSLSIGDYEAFKNAALDPYVSLRSAYHQNRVSQIKR